MRVFVTGATGYIGSAVSAALVRHGHEVLALARSPESAVELKEAGYEVVEGDLGEGLGLVTGASASDAVIHTAFDRSIDGPEVDAKATSALALMLEGTGNPLVYTSGTWLYGVTGDKPVREDDPLNPPAGTGWRAGVERLVLDAADRGVRSVVIRPGMVYGLGGGVLDWFRSEAQARGVVRVPEDGQQRLPFVHRSDLADLYVRALEARPASVFNGTAGTSPPARSLAELVGSRAVGSTVKVLVCSLEELRKEIGGFSDVLALDQGFVSNVKAMSELRWLPREAPLLTSLDPPASEAPESIASRSFPESPAKTTRS